MVDTDILLVDDDKDTCASMSDIFLDLGYTVDLAYDGQDALNQAGWHQYRLALLDFNMRILIHGIFAMILVFFLVGDRIVGTNCLTGFSWRAWLFLYSLPAWVTVSGATIKNPPVTLDEVR